MPKYMSLKYLLLVIMRDLSEPTLLIHIHCVDILTEFINPKCIIIDVTLSLSLKYIEIYSLYRSNVFYKLITRRLPHGRNKQIQPFRRMSFDGIPIFEAKIIHERVLKFFRCQMTVLRCLVFKSRTKNSE